MPNYPLLVQGFKMGWIQKLFKRPFDPLAFLLAMSTRMMLDAIDEMGKSYNLLRMFRAGIIDLGDFIDQEPDNPGVWYPPQINDPIQVTPLPGGVGFEEISYTPPGPATGQPGYSPPEPWQPGYVPPGLGQPGYGYSLPGQPGYMPPGEPGGITPIPQHPVGIGGGALYASLTAPWGYGFPNDQGGPPGGGKVFSRGWDCCFDEDSPTSYVSIGYETLEMDPSDIQSLTIEGVKDGCDPSIFTWVLDPDSGSLNVSNPLAPIYTAPAGGPDCLGPVDVDLYCKGKKVASIDIGIRVCPTTASIGYTTQRMEINGTQTLTAVPGPPGCGEAEYTWTITTGGGSLSSDEGDEVVYTAPASNPDCVNNPTITLSCFEEDLDTLQIAVNAYSGAQRATIECCYIFIPPNYHYSCYRERKCDGVFITAILDAPCTTYCGWTDKGQFQTQNCDVFPGDFGMNDYRTPAMIAAGCCPEELL